MSKIFISYKYSDDNVRPLPFYPYPTTVRNYVDELQTLIGKEHINKSENDGEDLSNFQDVTIASKLRDKIYDSSVTIVLISPHMYDFTETENDQWIPWEISYSLREKTRYERTSHSNAILAVVLPDRNNSYKYFIEENYCTCCNSILYKTNTLFEILRKNMFNRKHPKYADCNNSSCKAQTGYCSYIHVVKWDDFIKKHNHYIDIAKQIQAKQSEYNICKVVQA